MYYNLSIINNQFGRHRIIVNTFWLKVAAAAVGVVGVIILIGMFAPGDRSEPRDPEKSFSDQVEEDKRRFMTEPRPVEPQEQQPPSQQTETTVQKQPPVKETPVQPVQPPKPAEPTVLYFSELSEIEEIEAEKYYNAAVPGRSIGRLPMTGFKLMVDNCRRMIEKWPESWYAYKSQQLLIEMPERHQKRYKVTEQEKDVSRFFKQRPGTKPFTDEGSR